MTPAYLVALSARAYGEATWKAGGVEALLVDEGGFRAAAFRGTEFDFDDILRDLRGLPWRDPDLGWCHSGFLKGVRRIWPRMEPVLTGSDSPLYLTGHSKGAAEATLAAALLVRAGRPPAGLVTFGSPRAGMGKLSRLLAGVPTARYVNGADCVPDHPWPLWGYRHTGDAIFLGQPADKFLDHRIADYVERLS